VAQQDAQPQLVGEVIPPDQQDGVRESGYYTLTSGSDSQQAFTQDGQYFGGNFGFGSYPGSSSQFQPVSSSYQQPQYQQTLTTGIASVSQSYLPTSVYQTVPQQTSQQQSSQQPTQQPSHQTSQQQVETCPSPQILPDTYSHLLNDRPGGTGLESQTNNSITSSNTTSSTITTTMPSSSNTTITSSTHPPFDPSAASESECSEHPADGSSSKQHMGRKKIRKKKTLDRFPKLTVLSVTDTMVECQLETVKQKTITFKFDITDNDPQDVAYKLVMTNLLPGNHAEVVINYIEDIIRQLQVNPNVLPVVSIPGLDSPGQQHSQDGPTRSPSASRRHRDDPETRMTVVYIRGCIIYFCVVCQARYLARKLSRSSPKRRRRHSSHEEGGDSAPPTPSKRAEHRESLSHGSTSPV
ncbi:hypothetical protein OTU49_015105, partial [Cherax quadricarinatus]